MELHDIKKSYKVFHTKEIKDGVEKCYEFEINKVLAGKFAIRCKQCNCFIQASSLLPIPFGDFWGIRIVGL